MIIPLKIMNYKEYQSPSWIEAYKNAFENCLDFDGRSRRAEYWQFMFMYFLLGLTVCAICRLLGNTWLIIVFALIHLLPQLSMQAKRLHDCGHTSKWMLGLFVPFIGSIISVLIFIFSLSDSEKGENKWGESPKYYIEDD